MTEAVSYSAESEKMQTHFQPKAVAKTEKISLGLDDLKELITSAVAQAVAHSQESSAKIIAEAMLEARKPYVDPRQKQNEEMMREQMRDVQERINREIEASKASCPHLQGSNALSEFQGQLGSFILHQLDTTEVIGICSNCQKIIRSTNDGKDGRPDDTQYFMRKSANRLSRAGQRQFRDPTKAQLAR